MLILSLESAGSSCSACVWRDGKVLSFAEEHMERGQDQRLVPLIVEIMKQADVSFDDLDRIAVTRGPGSFTGLRIALATARGLGLAADKPVIGIDRFAVFRAAVTEPDCPLLVVLDSKRKELYCRFYPAHALPYEPAMMTSEEISSFLKDKGPVILAGDKALQDHSLHSLSDHTVITCARLASQANATSPDYLPRPLYLRAPDVTLKLSPTAQSRTTSCEA